MSRLGPTGLTQLLTDIKTWITTKLGNYVTTDTAQTVTGKKYFTSSTTQVNSVNTFTGSTLFIDTSASAPRGSFPESAYRVGRIYIGDGTSYNGSWVIIDPTIDTNRAYYRMVTTNPDNTDSTRFSIVWDSTKEGVRRRRNVSMGDLLPSGASTYNLGESGNAWQDAYINKIHGISDYTNLKTNSFNVNTTLTHGGSGRRVILAMGAITLTVPAPEEGSWFLIKAVNGLVTLNLASNVTVTGITAGAFSGPIHLQPNESILLCYYSSTIYNATISTIRRSGVVGRTGNVPSENPKHWFKIAENYVTATYRDPFICLRVFESTTGNTIGTLCAHCRINNTVGVVDTSNCYLQWQDAGVGFNLSKYALTTNETSGTGVTISLWCQLTGGYASLKFEVVSECGQSDQLGNPEWVLTRRRQADGDLAELLDTDFTKIVYSTLTTLKNDTTGKASNVTGTVAIANGGTGATTRLSAVKALTNESVGTPTHFLAITTNYAKAGYTTVAQAKTVLGITGDMGSHSDSEYVHMSGDETVAGVKTFSNNTYITSLNFTSEVESQSSSSSAVFPIVTTVTYADQSPSQTARLNFRITANGDKSLYPHENNQYSFGVTSRRWATLYGYLANLGGTYLGNEASPNERTNLYLLANRDADGQSGAYIGRFRQNRTQGAMESSDVSYITFDFLENSTRYTRCFTMGMTDWDSDKVPQTYYLTSPDGKGSLGTATNAWNKVYANSYYLGTTSFTDKFVTTDTAQTISGVKTLNSDTLVANQGNAYRIANSAGTGYGVFQRVDGSSWYLMVTAQNDALGTWTAARPASMNLSTGVLNINGNAGTATQFSANKDVTLTGDVTGTASSKAGWSVTTTLANSGVTAGSYGPSTAVSPAHGGTFTVPYITVDAKGRITAASTKTITLPADSNTDTKVTQTVTNDNACYPLLIANTASASHTGSEPTTETDEVRKAYNINVQARYGFIYARNSYTADNLKGSVAGGNRTSAAFYGSTYDGAIVGGVELGRVDKYGNRYSRLYATNYITDGALAPDGTAVATTFDVGVLADGTKYLNTGAGWYCNVYPTANNTRTLGTSSLRWKECYSNAYYLGTTAFGDIVTHNASEFLTSHQSLSSCVKNVVTNSQTIKSTAITRGTAPSSAQTFGIGFSDNNDKYIGNIYGQYATDKSTYVGLYAYKGTTTSNGDNASVRVGYDASGNAYTYAPTPATADNSTQIATTAFVKAQGYLTSHPSITLSTNTTSTESPSHGGTFTCIDSVTQDANGHITLVNTKTVTLPADSNTDTKVTQTVTTANSAYPVLLCATANATATGTTTSRFSAGLTVNTRYSSIYMTNKYDTANTKGVRNTSSSPTNGVLYFRSYDATQMGTIRCESSKNGYQQIYMMANNYIKNGAIDPEGTNTTCYITVRVRDNGSKTIYTDGSWENSLTPYANNTHSLGTSSLQWKNAYAVNFYENGTALSSKYVQINSLAAGNVAGALTHSIGSLVLARCSGTAFSGVKLYGNVAGVQLCPCRTEIYTIYDSSGCHYVPIVVRGADVSLGSGTWRYLGGASADFNNSAGEVYGMFLRVA